MLPERNHNGSIGFFGFVCNSCGALANVEIFFQRGKIVTRGWECQKCYEETSGGSEPLHTWNPVSSISTGPWPNPDFFVGKNGPGKRDGDTGYSGFGVILKR